MMTFSRAVIDADQMCYACGFATEGEPVENALHLVSKQVESILTKTGATSSDIFIKGKGNFRDEIAGYYKGTRDPRKPEHYHDIRSYLIDYHGATQVDGMEVDDMVSIITFRDYISNSCDPNDCNVVLVSPDKDLNNTPGWHYNPQKDNLYWVTDLQAERHLMFQMLAGDSVDNIPGLRGLPKHLKTEYGWHPNCGKVTAKKIMSFLREPDTMDTYHHCWSAVEALYRLSDHGDKEWHEQMAENHRLLHMARTIPETEPDHRLEWHSREYLVEDYLRLWGG